MTVVSCVCWSTEHNTIGDHIVHRPTRVYLLSSFNNLCDHLHPRNKLNDSIMKKVAPGVVIPPSHSMPDLPSGQSAASRKVFGLKRSQRSTNDASMATELYHNTFGEDLAVMS